MLRVGKEDHKFYEELKKQKRELATKLSKNKYANQKRKTKSKRSTKNSDFSGGGDMLGFPMIPMYDPKGGNKHSSKAGLDKKTIQKGYPVIMMKQAQFDDSEAVQTDESEYDMELQDEEWSQSEDPFTTDNEEDTDSTSDDE